MASYVEGECTWYKHIENVLFTQYASYKEWRTIREEIDTISLYIMQSKLKHICIAIYIP